MKVLYIVTAYPRGTGDVITPWLGETIQRLRPRGIDVEVLAPSYRGLGDQVIEGVKVHRFRYAPKAWETLTHDQTAPDRIRERPYYLPLVLPYLLSGTRAAARLARTGEYDVLHAFWPLPHGLLGLAAKRVSNVPLVSTFFGVELTWMESQIGFLRPLVRQIIRGSDAVTVISSHTAAQVFRLVPEAPLEVIPFGATVEVSHTAERTAPSHRGHYRLLFVGRLVERKGVAVLLDAMAKLRDRASVHLTVVGDGPLRGALKAHCKELGVESLVDFVGLVSGDQLRSHFAACDAFVLPAVQDAKGDVEGLGVVLLEALAFGKPVIASASGGIVDIVRHEESGLLVAPGDAEGLAHAVLRYIGDRDFSERLARRGRELVEEEFSWTSITSRLAYLYQRLALQCRTGDPA